MKYPAFDNHVHLNRNGRFLDAVREFCSKGGTGMMIVNLPPEGNSSAGDYFSRMYESAFDIKQKVSSSFELDVLLAVGPYPVTMLDLAQSVGTERAEEIMKAGVDLAANYVIEGKAEAIGEVGRPHFPVPVELLEASNRVMEYCMERCAEIGCPVILHSETATPSNMREIASMASRAGLDAARVVRHHSPPLVLEEENSGILPSVKATRDFVAEALSKGDRFLMETDYLDDPERPGAVLGIGTVPRRVREMVEKGLCNEDAVWKINSDIPSRVYSVQLRFSV